ncbi:MAG TPA: hypothetical protein VF659_06135 [Pyrinomonadaceae bacterium]|jgi:hypothetical protein
MAETSGDCYIDVWRDADFRGETLRLRGPAEYPELGIAGGYWGGDIGSLRVGPNAFVMAYRRRGFQDQVVTFGPNDEVADLSQFKFDDEIESLKVIDSLKIFDRLGYNSHSPAQDSSAAGDAGAGPEPGAAGARPNRNKGRRRPGRGR